MSGVRPTPKALEYARVDRGEESAQAGAGGGRVRGRRELQEQGRAARRARRPKDADELAKKAEATFERVDKEFGDEISTASGRIGDAAKAELFEIRNLRVGKTAPEIEGEDIDGAKFKLSRLPRQGGDARLLGALVTALPGHVPARAVAREATGRQAVRPDRRQQRHGPGATQEDRTRRRRSPGGRSGTATGHERPDRDAWNVRGWPTIYFIDHKGVIRDKNLRGRKGDRRVPR